MERIKIENKTFPGIWAIGWLFTIGYLHLPVLKAIFAIVLWPYYLGTAFGAA